MLETNEAQNNQESSKNEILDNSQSNNPTLNDLNANNKSETITIKQKVQSKFELILIDAYKKLVGSPEHKEEPKKIEQKAQLEDDEKLKILDCETELRNAIEESKSGKNIFMNKNILDKISRISKRNKINLSLLIGEIYINLMEKKNLFNKLNQKDSLNKNIIISFINEVINMNFLLKKTYLGIKYDNALFNFLEFIVKEIPFDSEQLNEINLVLQEHKEKKDIKKLNTNNTTDFLASINEAFNKQNSLYGQYKVVLDNCEEIVNLVNMANLEDEKEIQNFIKLGVLFVKLLFGKKCILLNDKHTDEEKNKQLEIKKFFDGNSDNTYGNINVILGEKFIVDYDADLEPMRENLCQIIINFVEKFKNATNLIELQYIQFVLLKRIYFYYFHKFEKEISPLFVQILINLCLFKDNEKIRPVVQFVNELLNSKDEKDENLKDLLSQKIEEAKSNSGFNFEVKKTSGNLEKMQNEVIHIEEPNLNLGFFTDIEIECGDTFDLYVELSKPFGFIDFTLDIREYDINFSVTNLSEGKVIYEEKKLKSDKAFKLNMFFTKPGIFKFQFDNSYSWITNKNISYKVSTFYPQYPILLENRVSISKYQENINNLKKLGGQKVENNNNLEIIQDQLSYQYNINDIKKNIELLNTMLIAFQVKILSIYLDKEKEEGEDNEKKNFYVEKENLEKEELTQENFLNYIEENKNKNGYTIVNLFIVTGDDHDVLFNRDLSLERVLGFDPKINVENNNPVLFFVEYFDQAQLLYYLCNKTEDRQNTLLINYTKFGGYQVCIYNNGEIISEVEELKKLKKNEFLENNIELISGYVKQLAQEHKIRILVTDSIDTKEENITADKMSESMQKCLGIRAEEEGNYKIIRLNKNYNKEVERTNHLLNLIE